MTMKAPRLATATSVAALMMAPGARGIKVEGRPAPTSDNTIQADRTMRVGLAIMPRN